MGWRRYSERKSNRKKLERGPTQKQFKASLEARCKKLALNAPAFNPSAFGKHHD